MKLKYKLRVENTTVHFQVLHMDEVFKGLRYIPDNEDLLYIQSIGYVALGGGSVYLLGTDIGDSDSIDFDTPSEAHLYAAKVHRSLEDWAKNWDGWHEEIIEKDVFIL